MPSRRQFLALAAALPALLALPDATAGDGTPGGAAPLATPGWDATDIAVLQAVLAAVFGPGGEQTDAIDALTMSFAFLDTEKQPLVAALPMLFDQASRVLVPTVTAFHSLTPAQQAAAVDDWATSPLVFRRQIFNPLRQLLLAHAYADPVTWPEIGYPGPWLGRIDLPAHPLRFGDPAGPGDAETGGASLLHPGTENP